MTDIAAARTIDIVAFADDLTGAAALGSEFKAGGFEVRIVRWTRLPTSGLSGALVVDTGSRLLSPNEAAGRVRGVCLQLRPLVAERTLIYKRLDSRLLGNWGAELAAVHNVFRRPIVMAPAAPRLGIATLDGIQLRDGNPISADEGPADSWISIGEQLDRDLLGPVAQLAVTDIRAPNAISSLVSLSAGHNSVCCDGDSIADLLMVAQAIAQMPPTIAGGTYGLGRALAEVLGPSTGRGMLAVCSSIEPVARIQLEMARLEGWHVMDMTVTSEAQIVNELDRGHDVVITSFNPDHADAIRRSADPAGELAALAVAVISKADLGGVIVIGGELASAMADMLDAECLTPLLEPWPTIGLLRLARIGARALAVVVKSGAQGPPSWIPQAADQLRSILSPECDGFRP